MAVHRQPREGGPAPSSDTIAASIRVARGRRVLLDEDLAKLYGVSTKAINQACGRNPDRFPSDFAFRLTLQELTDLKSHSVTSSWGGRRKSATAVTEQGVAMLSSVLRSQHAIAVNIAIMRTFVQLRHLLLEHKELAVRIDDLEQKCEGHDERIAAIFEAIRQLLKPTPPTSPPNRIGFAKDS